VKSFEEDLVIGELGFWSDRLKDILKAMEADERCGRNFSSYALKIAEVEKALRKIRNSNAEILEKYFV
jgi:hypothetical protein